MFEQNIPSKAMVYLQELPEGFGYAHQKYII